MTFRRTCGYNALVQGFAVIDLAPQGDVRQRTHYTHDLLLQLPGTPDLIGWCSGELWRSPGEFDVAMPFGSSRLWLRWWAAAAGAGILTLRESPDRDTSTSVQGSAQRLLSVGLLASGSDPQADHVTLAVFQQHVAHELHDTGYEPAFDLLGLSERPLLATMALASPLDPADRWLAAAIDRCFAASCFRRLGLA